MYRPPILSAFLAGPVGPVLSSFRSRVSPPESHKPLWLPAVDVMLSPVALTVVVDLPGVLPESVEIEIGSKRDILTISGSRKPDDYEESASIAAFAHRGRDQGPFHLEIDLPEEIDPHRAEATLSNGVLRLRVPRFESSPRQAPIKVPVGAND